MLLIAASSLIFSGSNQRTEAPYISGDGMPDDWNDYLDNYYQVTESKDAEIKLPRAELVPDFKVAISSDRGKELSLQELYDQCSKSIVAIKGYQDGVDGYFWGSGIILSSDGLILTNTHVIEGCDRATVTLYDDSVFEAKLVGADSISDIAVLKIEAKACPAELRRQRGLDRGRPGGRHRQSPGRDLPHDADRRHHLRHRARHQL